MVRLRGHYDGRIIILDEPAGDLKPGDVVEVIPLPLHDAPEEEDNPPPEGTDAFWEWLAQNPIRSDDLPADLSHQHDHYLYGTPKKPPFKP